MVMVSIQSCPVKRQITASQTEFFIHASVSPLSQKRSFLYSVHNYNSEIQSESVKPKKQ